MSEKLYYRKSECVKGQCVRNVMKSQNGSDAKAEKEVSAEFNYLLVMIVELANFRGDFADLPPFKVIF